MIARATRYAAMTLCALALAAGCGDDGAQNNADAIADGGVNDSDAADSGVSDADDTIDSGAAAAACQTYCTKRFDTCYQQSCPGADAEVDAFFAQELEVCLNGGVVDTPSGSRRFDSCATLYATNADFRAAVDSIQTLECPELTPLYCDAEIAPPEIIAQCECASYEDRGCVESDDCNEPSSGLQAGCFAEQTEDDSGAESYSGFPGGMCTAFGCQIPDDANFAAELFGQRTGCGAAGICLTIVENQPNVCLPRCFDASDCRDDVAANGALYTCHHVTLGAIGDQPRIGIGFCRGACQSDAECQSERVCGFFGTCEQRCDLSAANQCGDESIAGGGRRCVPIEGGAANEGSCRLTHGCELSPDATTQPEARCFDRADLACTPDPRDPSLGICTPV